MSNTVSETALINSNVISNLYHINNFTFTNKKNYRIPSELNDEHLPLAYFRNFKRPLPLKHH